jgi:hypothetical protein
MYLQRTEEVYHIQISVCYITEHLSFLMVQSVCGKPEIKLYSRRSKQYITFQEFLLPHSSKLVTFPQPT